MSKTGMQRIAITGLGAATAAGPGKQALWQSLTAGRTAIGRIATFDCEGLACGTAAEVQNLDDFHFPGKKTLWTITRSILFAYASALEAVADAGMKTELEDGLGIGVVFGSTLGGLTPLLKLDRQALAQGPRLADPLLFPSAGASAPSCQVSITGGAQAFNTTISNGQTSGLDAIHYACHFIRSGRAKAVIAGAVEEFSADIFNTCRRSRLLAGSRGGSDSACRPFDRKRSGFVLGEGAAALMLEEWEHALKRNASIYAEVTGYGCSFDPLPGRHGRAAVDSMQQAMARAGREPGDVGVIFASANGSVIGDGQEAEAIREVFTRQTPPVTAVKSIVGECYSAAGAIQTVAAVLALADGKIPGTCGFESSGARAPFIPVVTETVSASARHALINTFGRAGNHASLIVSSYVQ